jgi:hypothetical protein
VESTQSRLILALPAAIPRSQPHILNLTAAFQGRGLRVPVGMWRSKREIAFHEKVGRSQVRSFCGSELFGIYFLLGRLLLARFIS